MAVGPRAATFVSLEHTIRRLEAPLQLPASHAQLELTAATVQISAPPRARLVSGKSAQTPAMLAKPDLHRLESHPARPVQLERTIRWPQLLPAWPAKLELTTLRPEVQMHAQPAQLERTTRRPEAALQPPASPAQLAHTALPANPPARPAQLERTTHRLEAVLQPLASPAQLERTTRRLEAALQWLASPAQLELTILPTEATHQPPALPAQLELTIRWLE
jgi:hypothetical protein